MRLNKFIAHASGLSRRQADDAIVEGRVRVNGKLASLGERIEEDAIVKLDDSILEMAAYKYIALYKPAGYVSSRNKQGDAETLYTLLPEELQKLKLVGRLDKESEGLIILTNDGQFAHTVQHPSQHTDKKYEVWTEGELTREQLKKIESGIDIGDGESSFGIKIVDDHYLIHMYEGRNRQIRRTIGAVGHTVTKLKRISIGALTLEELEPGEYRDIDPKTLYNEIN